MASYMQEINILRLLLLVFATLPFVRTTNIDCNGKAFHCVNSTHFMICVDIGHGLSSTVDDFVIPCPMNTECRITNRFECEYPPPPSTTTLVSTTNQVIDFTTTLKKMETTALATTVSPFHKEKYVTVRETSFLEESVTIGPYTSADEIPLNANEILENVTEHHLDFQANEIDNGNGLNLISTLSYNDLDIIVADPDSTTTSPQDTTITESIAQVDEIPKTVYDSARNSPQYETTPINVVSIQTSTDFATDSDLVFTANNEFTTETFATDIYTNNKATTKNSEIVADGNILNADVVYIINEEFSTTTTDSVKLTSENIFATDNTDITTEFRTINNDIQDSFNVSPESISPTNTTFVDEDFSTLLKNVFNSVTKEPVTTQNFKVPLTSYTSLYEIPATDSTNYTTVNQDAEKYSGYNNERPKTNATTSKTDWEISVLPTDSDPLHFASTPSSTIINEASIITLDGYSTEPENSEMYVLTNNYTEKSFLIASNYTILNSKGIITKAKESKNISNLDENITKTYTDVRTTYDVLPAIENKVETVADFFDQVEIDMNIYKKSLSITSENLTLSEPVEFRQILNENGADVIEKPTTVTTENINNSGIMKVTADTDIQYSAGTTPELLGSISFTETATTTSKYDMLRIQQPGEKESVKIFTSEIDDGAYITGTILETSSNVKYTTIMSKTPGATLQELPTEADTKKLTSKNDLIPNIMYTIVPAIEQVARITKIFRPNSLSSKAEKSNVFNKDTTVTNSIQAIESTTNHFRTISQTTSQSTLNNYLKYYDTVTLANDELLMNNETTTPQTNIEKVIGTSSLKDISISKFHGTENMVIDSKSELVSTSIASNPDVQIDQAAYITVPVDMDSIDYDSNLKHIKNDIYKDTVKIQAKESDSINYDNNNMYGDVAQYNHLATDESTTNAQIIQNTINTDSKFHDMTSVNYEPIIFTTTGKNDILIVTSEYLDNKMGLATQSNADNIVGISSKKYIDNSKLQSGQDMVFQLEKKLVPTTVASNSNIRIGQTAHNTVPITTSDNIDYDGNLGYTENNIQKETHTSESSLSTFTNDHTNILLTSFTVKTDKPKSLDSSKFNSLSNTEATKLSPFLWENQTFQYFDKNMITTASIQSPSTIQHQNSDSFSYIDFITSNKKFEKEENNVIFATENGSSNRSGNNSNSMRYHDTVAIILNNTEITNISRIAIEMNNPALSTNNNDSSGTILNDNLTPTQNSPLKTHINTTKKVNNKPSIFKYISEVQNEIIKKDISVNANINSHKVITKTNPKDGDDNFILDINENKLASGNMSHDKFESNPNYNQIVNTFPILTVSAVLVETSSKTVRAKTENMTLPYGENRYQNSHTNIQNMTDEVKVRDGIPLKNTTSYSIDESNKQAEFAFSSKIITDPVNKNQTKGNLKEVHSNKANYSKLQNIKPNFDCLYRFRGRYADNENCRKFYICIGRPYPIFGMCPVNTVFSEFRKQCTKNLSHCVRNYIFHCTSEGRFSDIFNNNMYYICVKTPQNKFVRYKLQCENGYYLNKDSMQCVEKLVKAQLILDSDNSQRSSDTSITNSNESRKIINKGDDFICEKEGKFPVLNYCRKYYVCSKNKLSYKRKLKLCDSDEVFDKNKEKCVDAESYEC